MRLHTLTLQAFGPFAGTHTIDFDSLTADGLFLLHGDTERVHGRPRQPNHCDTHGKSAGSTVADLDLNELAHLSHLSRDRGFRGRPYGPVQPTARAYQRPELRRTASAIPKV